MTAVKPVSEAEATEPVARTYGRIKELFGSDHVPEVFLYYGSVPAFLQDFYMNFKKFVYGHGHLDARIRALIALAVSGHCACRPWQEFWETELQRHHGGTPQQIAEVYALVGTNAMYNTFFKFRELAGTAIFEGMGVGLRAHTFGGTSLDEATTELINIAISVINACGPCTAGHVKQAGALKASDAQILETVQCAATMLSGIRFLQAVL